MIPNRFVFFKTQKAAALASQALIHGEDNREFTVMPAPGPEEVGDDKCMSDIICVAMDHWVEISERTHSKGQFHIFIILGQLERTLDQL